MNSPIGMHQMWGMGGSWMILWWIFLIALIVGIIMFITRLGATGPGKSALDILKERYVRGEISKQEFEDKKKDITT